MPYFMCPCCGEAYIVPLAYCGELLEEKMRQGWAGAIAPVHCTACQGIVVKGDAVTIRRGPGVTDDGEKLELPKGAMASVLDVATWEGEGSIYRLQTPAGEAYVARAQVASSKPPARVGVAAAAQTPSKLANAKRWSGGLLMGLAFGIWIGAGVIQGDAISISIVPSLLLAIAGSALTWSGR
jgi:hypothetical protein